VPEASGVAVRSGSPEGLWVLKDSGDPILYGIDLDGRVTDRVLVSGAEVEDWEDLAAGPCPQGRCLYIADIGDNSRKRTGITIYRVPEPARGASTASAEALHARYPDGPHNAEGFFVDGDRAFVVTKERVTTIYRVPSLKPGGQSQLEDVARVMISSASESAKGQDHGALATGAALSPDGAWAAIRSHHTVLFFKSKELLAGKAGNPIRVDVAAAGEPQGEAITFGSGGTVYLVGEGGRRGRPGTLTRMTCTLTP